jgi:hypothetical protein
MSVFSDRSDRPIGIILYQMRRPLAALLAGPKTTPGQRDQADLADRQRRLGASLPRTEWLIAQVLRLVNNPGSPNGASVTKEAKMALAHAVYTNWCHRRDHCSVQLTEPDRLAKRLSAALTCWFCENPSWVEFLPAAWHIQVDGNNNVSRVGDPQAPATPRVDSATPLSVAPHLPQKRAPSPDLFGPDPNGQQRSPPESWMPFGHQRSPPDKHMDSVWRLS